MKPEKITEHVDLYNGDCLEVMKSFPDNHFTAIVTDPPYGLEFMGREWDSFSNNTNSALGGQSPANKKEKTPFKKRGMHIGGGCKKDKQVNINFQKWNEEWAREALRVAKPGAMLLAFGGTRTYHRLTCAIEDAGWQIRDCLMWVYGCVSEDTEILTKGGWKRYTQLTKKDIILQWDAKTNKLLWTNPKEIFIYDFDGAMVNFVNRHTDQLLTPNHRVYVKIQKCTENPRPTKWEVIEAHELKKHWYKDFPLAGELEEGIQVNNAYLIGWWLTDAWKHKDGKACMFSQSKKITLIKLRNLLKVTDCNFSEYTKTSRKETPAVEHIFYVTGNIATYLLTNFNNRELKWDVLQWNYKSRFELLEGLLDGSNGSRSKTGSYPEAFWSLQRERLDIVQALCFSLNIRSYIDYKKGCVYLNRKHNSTQLQSKHGIGNVIYKGKVWCIETETGAFTVRRNGKIFITGNSGFPKSHSVSTAIDKKLGKDRKVIGKRTHPTLKNTSKIEEQANAFHGSNEWKREWDITTQATPEAKTWDGYGTALKPAYEPIVLAMKPLDGTYANNALKWGTGGLNIDGCWIETNKQDLKNFERLKGFNNIQSIGGKEVYQGGKVIDWTQYDGQKGRWPANFILSHHPECVKVGEKKVKGSRTSKTFYKTCEGESTTEFLRGVSHPGNQHADKGGNETIEDWNCHPDCPIKILNQQSGHLKSGLLKAGHPYGQGDNQRVYAPLSGIVKHDTHADEGGASRFFKNLPTESCQSRFQYQAKASRRERNNGCEDLEERECQTGCGGAMPIDDKGRERDRFKKVATNVHPTVKPLKLMEYLTRLIKQPEENLILDPFAGSGTTGMACQLQNINCVLIEREKEYRDIIKCRVKNVHKLEDKKPKKCKSKNKETKGFFDLSELDIKTKEN